MLENTATTWPPGADDPLLEDLQLRYIPSASRVDMAGLLADPRLGLLAVVSSFGAESAVLLHYVASLRPGLPVLFIDTGRHFTETLNYMRDLASHLGLEVVSVLPDARLLRDEDPEAQLWRKDPSMCCRIRKVFPLQDALAGFDSWISGRKRFQSGTRQALPLIERDGAKVKVNPLALWSPDEIADYALRHGIPAHPLVARGYASIGCEPCTSPVAAGQDPRAGRWSHVPEKTECGIHLGPDGRFRRA